MKILLFKRSTGLSAPLPLEDAILQHMTPEPSQLGKLLCSRRSQRFFSSGSIPHKKLERIMLDCAGGVRAEVILAPDTVLNENTLQCETLFRTIPQGGAICSTGVTVVLLKPTEKIGSGIYKLCPHTNSLHKTNNLPGENIIIQAMGQHKNILLNPNIEQAAAILIITTDFESKAYKYGKRGYRYALVEVGCALQNALLSICDQGLAAYTYCGFNDELLAEMLGLHFPAEAPIATVMVGLTEQPNSV